MCNLLEFAQRDVGQYESATERWKVDYERAMECRDFEDLIARGILAFDAITHVDESWRHSVASGRSEYDASLGDTILELYRRWYMPCPGALEILEQLELAGYDVDRAGEFRSRCGEAKGILTEDDKFFTDDKLVKLRDNAIDSHRNGNTSEYRPT